ncbi:MAG: Wzz/FepE/Etk N-terminal domain-containing protein, partial [Acidimicrobiia bacterium]
MAQFSDELEQPGLRERVWLLWSHKWSILIVTAITVGIALFFTSKQEPVYSSEARVLVDSGAASIGMDSSGFLSLSTEVELAMSGEVTKRAARLIEVEEDEIPGSISVSEVPDTTILSFLFTSADAESAPLGAQAFAEGYLDFKLDQLSEELVTLAESLQLRLSDATDRLARLNNQIEATRDPALAATLQARANSVAAQVTILQQQMANLGSPDVLQVGKVTQSAGPAAVSGSSPTRNGILA